MSRVGAKDWLPNTDYEIDDQVYIDNRILVRCITVHNSGTIYDPSNWEVVAVINPNIVDVFELGDFPTPIGNVITLEDNVIYMINGQLDIGANSFAFGDGTRIIGVNGFESKLTQSSGTMSMFHGTDKTFSCENIKLQSNTSIIEADNSALDKHISFRKVAIMDTPSVGVISGYGRVQTDNVICLNCSNGLSVDGTKNVDIISSSYNDSNNGIFLTLDGNINKVLFSDNTFDTASGTTILKQKVTATIGLGVVSNNVFQGAGIYIDGITSANNPEWTFVGNKGIDNNVNLMRITDTEMSSYVNPEEGAMFWNTDRKKVVVFDGTQFIELDSSIAYTTLFYEDWESGDFTTNGRTTVNNSPNEWIVGVADKYEGTYSAYISDDGGTSTSYTETSAVWSHLYVDVNIPTGISDLQLRAFWKTIGESGYDYMRVYTAPTSFTPTAGSEPSGAGVTQRGGDFNQQSSRDEGAISLGDTFAGNTIRIIISWRNDGSVGTNPGGLFDNFKVSYI